MQTTLNPSEISELIKQRVEELDISAETRNEGTVVSVSDGIARVHGLEDAMQGEMIEFPGNTFGLALNLERDSVGSVILGDYEHITEGDTVKCTGRILEVPQGRGLLGRVVDALGNRNGKRASLLLQQKLNEGTDPLYLFSMFVRQFRLLIQVKELADAGYRPQGIAREIKQHSFVVGKLFQQARGFSMAELEQIYEHLLDIDIAVKTGEADIRTALDLLVANLTITA